MFVPPLFERPGVASFGDIDEVLNMVIDDHGALRVFNFSVMFCRTLLLPLEERSSAAGHDAGHTCQYEDDGGCERHLGSPGLQAGCAVVCFACLLVGIGFHSWVENKLF